MDIKHGGDIGVGADLNKQEGEVIYIDGYWLDGGEKFANYMCIIGEWNGDENDYDIFYYFKDEVELKLFMEVENRTDTEFVVTKVERE